MRSTVANTAPATRALFDSPDPIDAYLQALRHSLRSQHDAEELVAEAEDHLREAVERQVLAGAEPARAHEAVLAEFGDARLIARALVRTRLHTVPEASRSTRAAGVLGRWAAAAWLVALLVHLYQVTSDPWLGDQYVWFELACGVAALLTMILIIGLFLRAGASRTVGFAVAVLFALVALTGNVGYSWMWPITNPLIGIAMLAGIAECRRAGLSLGAARFQLATLIWPLATAVALAGHQFAVGPIDEWGDHPLLNEWAYACAAVLFAGACWTIGSTLAAEPVEPVAATMVSAVPITFADVPRPPAVDVQRIADPGPPVLDTSGVITPSSRWAPPDDPAEQ